MTDLQPTDASLQGLTEVATQVSPPLVCPPLQAPGVAVLNSGTVDQDCVQLCASEEKQLFAVGKPENGGFQVFAIERTTLIDWLAQCQDNVTEWDISRAAL